MEGRPSLPAAICPAESTSGGQSSVPVGLRERHLTVVSSGFKAAGWITGMSDTRVCMRLARFMSYHSDVDGFFSNEMPPSAGEFSPCKNAIFHLLGLNLYFLFMSVNTGERSF